MLDRLLGLLLSLEAIRISDTVEVRSSLLDGLQYSPHLISYLRGQGAEATVAFSPDSKVLASGGLDGSVMLWDVATGKPIGIPLRGQREL